MLPRSFAIAEASSYCLGWMATKWNNPRSIRTTHHYLGEFRVGKGHQCECRRADLVAGQSITVPNRSASEWFNPAAFANPSPTSPGTSGVGSVLGPGFFATDLSLRKVFGCTGKHEPDVPGGSIQYLQSRQFCVGRTGYRDLNRWIGQFRSSGSAVNPRNVQFGLKFNF